MRIPNTTFSEYIVGSKKTFDIQEWSKKIISRLSEMPGEDRSLFNIIVTCDPNPPGYKGVDDYKIEIKRTHRMGMPVDYLFRVSDRHSELSQCALDIEEYIDDLESAIKKSLKQQAEDVFNTITQDGDVIEVDGKKYRLVEVK